MVAPCTGLLPEGFDARGCDVSERVTEVEIQDVERALVGSLSYAPGVTEGQANLARGVARYIAEVRRLRGLIVPFVEDKLGPDQHDERYDALRAEAETIQAERTLAAAVEKYGFVLSRAVEEFKALERKGWPQGGVPLAGAFANYAQAKWPKRTGRRRKSLTVRRRPKP
jgi:hypothetical protein